MATMMVTITVNQMHHLRIVLSLLVDGSGTVERTEQL